MRKSSLQVLAILLIPCLLADSLSAISLDPPVKSISLPHFHTSACALASLAEAFPKIRMGARPGRDSITFASQAHSQIFFSEARRRGRMILPVLGIGIIVNLVAGHEAGLIAMIAAALILIVCREIWRLMKAELQNIQNKRKKQISRLLAYARQHALRMESEAVVYLILAGHGSRYDHRFTFKSIIRRIAQQSGSRSIVFWLEDAALRGMPKSVLELQRLTNRITEFRGIHWRHELSQPTLQADLRQRLAQLAAVRAIPRSPDDTRYTSDALNTDLIDLAEILQAEGWSVQFQFERPPIDAYIHDLKAKLLIESLPSEREQRRSIIHQYRKLGNEMDEMRDRALAERIAQGHRDDAQVLHIVSRGGLHLAFPYHLQQQDLAAEEVRQPFTEQLLTEFRSNLADSVVDWMIVSDVPDALRVKLVVWIKELKIDDHVWRTFYEIRRNSADPLELGMKLWLWLTRDVVPSKSAAMSALINEITMSIHDSIQRLSETERDAPIRIGEQPAWINRFLFLSKEYDAWTAPTVLKRAV